MWLRLAPAPRLLRSLPWRTAPWATIDVETTGLDLRRDDVISIGVVPITDGAIDAQNTYYSLVQPQRPVDPRAVEIHGIRPIDLAEAPTAARVAADLARVLDNRLIAAHVSWVEHAFMTRLARRTRTRLPAPFLDTAAMSRAAGRAHTIKGIEPSLELMARTLRLPIYTPHHALGDAMTTAVLFLALAHRLAPAPDATAQELQNLTDHTRAPHSTRNPRSQPEEPTRQ